MKSDILLENMQRILESAESNFSEDFFKILKLNNLSYELYNDSLIITNRPLEILKTYFDDSSIVPFTANSDTELYVNNNKFTDIYEAIQAFYDGIKEAGNFYNYGPDGDEPPASPFFRYTMPNVKKLNGDVITNKNANIFGDSNYNVDFNKPVYYVTRGNSFKLKPKEVRWFQKCSELGVIYPVADAGYNWVCSKLQSKSPAYVHNNGGKYSDYISWARIFDGDTDKFILAILQNPNTNISDTKTTKSYLSNEPK